MMDFFGPAIASQSRIGLSHNMIPSAAALAVSKEHAADTVNAS